MKIQKLTPKYTVNNSVNKQNKAPQTSFKGGVDGLIKFWEAIDRGGFAASFLLQDVSGACIPRVAISLNRGREKGDPLNYVAGAEVAIRELTTGSSMFLVPGLAMMAATKATGGANEVSMKNLKAMSEIMKDISKGGKQVSKEEFYKGVMDAVALNTLDGKHKFDDDFIAKIVATETAPKRGFIKKMFNKDLKGRAGAARDQLVTKLENVYVEARSVTDTYEKNLMGAKLVKNGSETNFAKLLTEMKNYYDDFAKNVKGKINADNAEKLIDNFAHKRAGTRFLSGLFMTAATVLAMTLIPKLYTLSDTNPEAKKGEGGGK